jgi:hypothetical protein
MRFVPLILLTGHSGQGAIQQARECEEVYKKGSEEISKMEERFYADITEMIESTGDLMGALDAIKEKSEILRTQTTELNGRLGSMGCEDKQEVVKRLGGSWLRRLQRTESSINNFRQLSEKLDSLIREAEEMLQERSLTRTNLILEEEKFYWVGQLRKDIKYKFEEYDMFSVQIGLLDQRIERLKLHLQEAQEEVSRRHASAGTSASWFSREGYLDRSAHGIYIWDGLKEHDLSDLARNEFAFFGIHDKTSQMGFVVLSYNPYLHSLEIWKVKRPLDRNLWVPTEDWIRGFCSTALPLVLRDFVAKMKPKIETIGIYNDAKDDNVAACHCYINTFRTLGFTKVSAPHDTPFDSLMKKCLERTLSREFRMLVEPVDPKWEMDPRTEGDGLKILSKASIRFDAS